ncbi:glycosyl hydrolase [bacterium]|nr:glycosyl hydrolase [bacterium]
MTNGIFHRQLVRLIFVLLVSVLSVFDCHAQIVTVGKATYREDLPPGDDGKPRRSVSVGPLVSPRIKGPIPTNDWWSSLVWPSQSPHSLAMFPHPLAVKAQAKGLGIGYNPKVSISNSYREQKLFQTGTSYKYPYRESMVVGLAGLESENCVLDGFSDWSVTSLWKNGSDEMRATFAHGSPFVYFERNSNRDVQIDFTAAPINRYDEPIDPIVFELNDVTGKHNGESARINLLINAGKDIGIGSKARLTYDFDGDGKTDRVETFGMLPTDPVESSWEVYSSDKQVLDDKLTRGEMEDFQGGTIKLEFWKCFGKGSLELRYDDSQVTLPMENGKFFLSDGKLAKAPSAGTGKLAGGEDTSKAARVFYRNKNVLGVTVNGTHYGLFAPSGSTWTPDDEAISQVTSKLDGKNYFSVAVLPDSKPATIKWYQQFAYAFLTDTRIDYRYDSDDASVKTTYTVTTEAKEGTTTATLFGLYRHQYLNLTQPKRTTDFTYVSPRGEMKIVEGDSFETSTPFLGVLPALPNAPGTEKALLDLVNQFYSKVTTRKSTFERDDTYWNGKEFGKFSEVIQIADQLGQNDIRDKLVKLLQGRLEAWADANSEFFFYYDGRWNILIGYPDSYGSGDQFNDHHFHYSYFIKAAATIAQFDPDWVKPENYGGFIDLLIRSCANYDRSDDRFPWLRFFDPYAGHSWASGHAGFASGNNQESSSESMNFATSLILYGEATNNNKIRELGIYWHATEAEAIRNYWFDQDEAVFPEGYGHRCVGMIWGDGGSYGTWWTANPEEIHGINFLPINGGSLHLGRDPDYVRQNFENMLESNRNFHHAGFEGDPEQLDRWHDVLYEYLALSDPSEALNRYDKSGRDKESEFGESKVHTQQWLDALQHLGHFDPSIRANYPTAVAFTKDGLKSYTIYNGGVEDRKVRFTDGFECEVPPGLHIFKAN